MSQRFSILTILLLSGGLPLTAAGQVDRGSQALSGKEKKVAAASDASGDVLLDSAIAAFENYQYVSSYFINDGAEAAKSVLIHRSYTAILLHSLCGVFMGFYIREAIFRKENYKLNLILKCCHGQLEFAKLMEFGQNTGTKMLSLQVDSNHIIKLTEKYQLSITASMIYV